MAHSPDHSLISSSTAYKDSLLKLGHLPSSLLILTRIPSNMETQKSHLTMIMPILMLLLLLLLVGNHAMSITEAPSPQPQSANTTVGRGHLPLYGTTEGSLNPQECGPRCTERCSRTQYRKPCLFFCNKCCAKCLCVPPGYYGNKQFCPCYNDWKTKRGGPKCP